MRGRDWVGIGAGLLSGLAALCSVPAVGLVAAIPPAVAVAVTAGLLADWPRARRWLALGAGVAAATSLGATVITFVVPYQGGTSAGMLGLLEVAVLLLLLGLVVRWAPPRQAGTVGGLTAVAVATWVLRFLPDPTPLTTLAAVALWSIGAAGAGVAGGYPRLAELRRQRSVSAARRAQRLDLARDLHDFVAHDVTGIVVQAQAAQLVGRDDPDLAFEALKRIEEAGLQALGSMDQAVQMLRDDESAGPAAGPGGIDPGGRAPQPGLADLTTLVERFSVTGPPAVRLHLDRLLAGEVPREVGATAYRIVVEALTNVRRHAPAATRVDVTVDLAPGAAAMLVSVGNDLPGAWAAVLPRTLRGGGSGLVELTERVRALGGTLDAGPAQDGWRVKATLPLPGSATRR